MFTKILAITALSLSLGGVALAQTATESNTSGDSPGAAIEDQMPTSWQGPIAGAFFTDDTGVTLRSDDEIRTGWAALSAEQQTQVKADCDTALSNNTAESNSNTEESASGPMAMQHLCTMVGEM